jgi:hypothetical protein
VRAILARMQVPPLERRRDRRVRVTGQAVLRPVGREGTDVFGGILDVSAGGVRLRVRPGSDVEKGDRMSLDLEIPMPSAPATVPPVRLFGHGQVLRLDLGSEGASEAALRFEAPLEVCEFFGPGAFSAGGARRSRPRIP